MENDPARQLEKSGFRYYVVEGLPNYNQSVVAQDCQVVPLHCRSDSAGKLVRTGS